MYEKKYILSVIRFCCGRQSSFAPYRFFIKYQCHFIVDDCLFPCFSIPHLFIQITVPRLLQNRIEFPSHRAMYFFAQSDRFLCNPLSTESGQNINRRYSFVHPINLFPLKHKLHQQHIADRPTRNREKHLPFPKMQSDNYRYTDQFRYPVASRK